MSLELDAVDFQTKQKFSPSLAWFDPTKSYSTERLWGVTPTGAMSQRVRFSLNARANKDDDPAPINLPGATFQEVAVTGYYLSWLIDTIEKILGILLGIVFTTLVGAFLKPKLLLWFPQH